MIRYLRLIERDISTLGGSWPGTEHFPGPGIYFSRADGRIYIVYGTSPETMMITTIDSQNAAVLLAAAEVPAPSNAPVVDPHRLMDQMIDLTERVIDAVHHGPVPRPDARALAPQVTGTTMGRMVDRPQARHPMFQEEELGGEGAGLSAALRAELSRSGSPGG